MSDQKLADLNENGNLYKAAKKATNAFRRQLHNNVIMLNKEGYTVEVLAKESGLPINVVQNILSR